MIAVGMIWAGGNGCLLLMAPVWLGSFRPIMFLYLVRCALFGQSGGIVAADLSSLAHVQVIMRRVFFFVAAFFALFILTAFYGCGDVFLDQVMLLRSLHWEA